MSLIADLPEELIQSILSYLNIEEIAAVRLATKYLSIRASDSFEWRRAISEKEFEMSPDVLPDLSRYLSDVAWHLRTIRIVLRVYDTRVLQRHRARLYMRIRDDPRSRDINQMLLDEAEDGMTWLEARLGQVLEERNHNTQFLKHLFQLAPNIQSIYLDTVVITGRKQDARENCNVTGHRANIWATAQRGFESCMTALAGSSLQLKSLHIFKNTERCFLLTNSLFKVSSIIKQCNLTNIETLSLNISSPIGDISAWQKSHHSSNYGGPHGLQLSRRSTEQRYVLRDLLQTMTSLKRLDIFFFTTFGFSSVADYPSFLEEVMRLPALAHLQHLTLRGFYANARTVADFIDHMIHLKTLTLEHLRIVEGSWISIENAISKHPTLQKLSVASLKLDTGSLLHLDQTGNLLPNSHLELVPQDLKSEFLEFPSGLRRVARTFSGSDISNLKATMLPPETVLRSPHYSPYYRNHIRFGPSARVIYDP